MRGSRRLLTALLAGAPAVALAQPTAPPAAATIATASFEEVAPRIDALFRAFQQDAHVPGMVWGIVRDGRLVHVGFSGVQDLGARRPVDADTLFRIASMSKVFTALAILRLRDAGRLSLDAPAETYVPEMRGWHYPTADSPRIRVRDLLNHAGGFVTDDPWGDRQTPMPDAEFTALLRAGVPFTRTPQTAYEYSNFGFAILGRIVTNVSGRPYADYIRDEIMEPLGMASTGYDVSLGSQERRALGYRWENDAWTREPDMGPGAFGAMGGVQTSARDYARWIIFLLSAWPPSDEPERGPAQRSTVRELTQGSNFPQLGRRPGTPNQNCPQALTYGMGLRVANDCELGFTLSHGGGYPGYGSFMLLLPERGTGIFAFANRTYAGPSPPVWDAAAELLHAELLSPRPLPVSEALAAAYRDAGAIYQAGTLAPGRNRLAMNFLMDRSADNWARELTRLKAEVGDCDTTSPITATGALAGRFQWTCARGRLDGQLLLAPTRPPTIQALRFTAEP
jgi:serine-type D-Ala-D-Ala carboxypeptidase/endopeptidase